MHLSITAVTSFWDELEKISGAISSPDDLSQRAKADIAAVSGLPAPSAKAERPFLPSGRRLSSRGASDVAAVMGHGSTSANGTLKAWLARIVR